MHAAQCSESCVSGAVMCFFYNQQRHIRESTAENRDKKAEQYKTVLKRSRKTRVSTDHETAQCTVESA